jgi:GT2 family glycosyltransferase
MYPTLEPINHLAAGGMENGRSLWRSTGDDPGFLIRLPLLRPRYLAIRLHGRDRILAPQLYLNFGDGFREKDSIAILGGRDILLMIDVGRMGFIRSLRLDPAACPASFACEIEACTTRDEAQARAGDWAGSFPDGRVEWIDRIGLAWCVRQRLPRPFGRPALATHLDAIYRLAEQEVSAFDLPTSAKPWLSMVVPTFNTPVAYLDDLLRSFRQQGADDVELVFSDDASTAPATREWLRARQGEAQVRVIFNPRNGGIAAATNAGLAAARGTWITFLDHDDAIAPSALKMVRRTLRDHPQAQFLYTDEVVVDGRLKPRGLMAKPAYDPVLLSGVNYINHFSFYRRDRMERLGWLREGFEGSQDYDMVLRYLDGIDEDAILHLPYPAYWWRRDGNTFSTRHLDLATASARKALGEHFARRGQQAGLVGAITPTLHRVNFTGRAKPKISVIVPSKNAFDLITTVIGDLTTRTDYPDLETLIVDNGSDDPRVLAFYDDITVKNRNIQVHRREEPFNFARSINRGLSLATGEHFLLFNNDVSVIRPDWLSEMVSCLGYERAGIVGAKLLYPDSTIQHAGVVAGFGGLAGHWYLNKPADFGGPMNRLHVRSSMTCVTAAAMLVSGSCRAATGDMDEENFAVAYNDVDYCLRAYRNRFRTIWTPFATLFHHESATRGSEKTLKNRLRFEREKQNLRSMHGTERFCDPAASPLFGRDRSTPILASLESLPPARLWHQPADETEDGISVSTAL